ncbi:hypothetical protein [Nostoc sp. NIES-3756]|nr:hypothetical protein [Nostoc sp. NIES-3756]
MKLFLPQNFTRAAVNKSPRMVEPKCKIQPTGAGDYEIMFVRTS